MWKAKLLAHCFTESSSICLGGLRPACTSGSQWRFESVCVYQRRLSWGPHPEQGLIWAVRAVLVLPRQRFFQGCVPRGVIRFTLHEGGLQYLLKSRSYLKRLHFPSCRRPAYFVLVHMVVHTIKHTSVSDVHVMIDMIFTNIYYIFILYL